MGNAKKRIIIVSVVILIFAVLAFLFAYHLPEKIETTVRVTPEFGVAELADREMEITLRVKRWKMLFSADRLAGSVSVDGIEYSKAQGWRLPNQFHTPHPATDGKAHIVTQQEVLDWMQNYVALVLDGRQAALHYSNFPAEKIATYVFSIEDSK